MKRVAQFFKVSTELFIEAMKEEFPQYTEEDIRDMYESLMLPKRATKGSAGYDFFAPEDTVFPAKKLTRKLCVVFYVVFANQCSNWEL